METLVLRKTPWYFSFAKTMVSAKICHFFQVLKTLNVRVPKSRQYVSVLLEFKFSLLIVMIQSKKPFDDFIIPLN